jgi:proteasome lid subunit RPN8/RPN11
VTAKAKRQAESPALIVSSEVLRGIRQHARSQSKTEVCGVLIGNERGGKLRIEASIPGANATQGGTHVTFTQDTWEHIYKIKDSDYPDDRILGWYHSHPGFGVFLSDHDTFIHQNFFSSPQQVAWVYDPHSDEEGCFGWVNGRLERLSQLAISDSRGGELAGETGKPEPLNFQAQDDPEFARDPVSRYERRSEREQEPRWMRWMVAVLWHLSIFACGAMVAWALFPRVVGVPVPVDPRTGEIIQPGPDQQIKRGEQPSQNPDSGSGKNPGDSGTGQKDSAEQGQKGSAEKVKNGPRH